jgi:putative ABC transport system permease protein
MTFHDIRLAVRSLVHDRSLSAIVVLCLALGIGVNATLFSVIDGVLIQPLPFQEPDRLVVLNQVSERRGIREAGVSYLDLQDIRERATSLSTVAASGGRVIALSDRDEAERVQGAAITSNLFPTLGVRPILGRHFRDDDDRPGAEPVVMLSHEIWQRRYHGDPAVVGRIIKLNGKPHAVIGVMPPRFSFPQAQKVWIPLGPNAATDNRDSRYLFALGRLKSGVDLARTRGELVSIASELSAQYPSTNDGWSAMVQPLTDRVIPNNIRLVLATMMGAVTLVLLVACANVANLMLARSSGRQREFCVRAALGAGRAQLVKQLLTECVALALAAAPLGLAIAYCGVWLLDQAVPPNQVPSYLHWEISGRGIAYTIILSALTGLVFGLAPVLQAGRLDLQEALRDGARGSGHSRRRARLCNALVMIEVAMALILLVGASLFVRSFLNLQSGIPGFDTAPLLTARFFMTGGTYATDEQKAQRVDDIMRRVEAWPGVVAAFASNFVPLDAGGGSGHAIVDGRAAPVGEEPLIVFTAVTPHLYRTMGLSIVRGRDFLDAEGAGRAPVAVINETMAKKLWPGTDAIGRRFRLVETEPPEWLTVIGVAPDIRMFDRYDDKPPIPAAYVPYRFASFENIGLTIRAANNDPATLAAAVRREIRASDAGLPIFDVRTMEDLRREGFWQFRVFAYMFGIFGAAALFLAGVGVYGVLSFSVSQRTQEMGVRIALGASRAAVLGLVVRQGAMLALIGVAAGLVGAFGITRVIRSLLYHVTPTDPLSFGGVTLFLVGIAVLASYLPARRATNVDPIIALRNE